MGLLLSCSPLHGENNGLQQSAFCTDRSHIHISSDNDDDDNGDDNDDDDDDKGL